MTAKRRAKPVTATEPDGTVREFASIKETAEFYGKSATYISRACSGELRTDIRFEAGEPRTGRHPEATDADGNVHVYASVTEAAKALRYEKSCIYRALRHARSGRETCYGMVWKWVEDR